jgi:hypothetical protein
MALPLPRVVSDVGPGGPLVTAMGGINSLANDMVLRKMNQVKAQYLPMTTQAEAASKLAYANLMGPQFMAKLMANPGFLGNTPNNQLQAIREMITRAGTGQGTGNALMQGANMPAPEMSFLDKMKNSFQGLLGQGQQGQPRPTNPMAQMPQMQGMQMPSQGRSQGFMPEAVSQQNPMLHRPKDGVSVEGEQWYNAKGEPVYEEDVSTPDDSMRIELTKDIPPKKTYAENTGEYLGTVKQGEEGGKFRAKALDDIGKSQLGLSNSGAVLDRMTDIVKNPVFANMRNTIPFFQDKQLSWIQQTGKPAEQRLIGDFLSTAESFIASTVQAFGSKPLVREFDLAQRQKITPKDTIGVAEGKLQSAIALHDIAEQKNQIVSELLDKGYSEAEAVKQANKMVDVSAIERDTERRLEDQITDEDIELTAKENGMTKEQVIQRLKSEGRYHG